MKDGTLASVVETLYPAHSLDGSRGWNDYPIYLVCKDGVTRPIKTIGTILIGNGWRDHYKANNQEIPEELKSLHDGGIYLQEQ